MIARLEGSDKLLEFLSGPLPAYAMVSVSAWNDFRAGAPRAFREVKRHYDLYDGQEVVLVTNEKSSQ